MQTVLVVDDSTAMRHAIRRILQERGYAVMEAGNGAEALEHCRADSPPDLVLLDIDMPVMNGLDFLAALRAGTDASRLPVVMCSTHASAAMIEAALAAGAQDYIMKPFDAEILAAKLSSLKAA
jgi:two-component system, chemotaxis family, chemotaxis protein CheY